jgi:putative flippase GtrA
LTRGPLERAFNNRPLRFLISGGWNTAFAYLSLAALYYFLSEKIHYMAIIVFSAVLNITQAYIVHKFFVFKTRGNYLREYLRYYVVYAVPTGLGLIIFPFCIEVLRMNFYLVQVLLTFTSVVISYFGHKRISFKT